jgi:hypothetical protein
LSGFHGNKAGCAFHNSGWVTDGAADRLGMNWVLSSDTNNPPMYRANGTDYTAAGTSSCKLTAPATMTISMNEMSDYNVAEVILYNTTLTSAQILQVEAYLRAKYTGVGF